MVILFDYFLWCCNTYEVVYNFPWLHFLTSIYKNKMLDNYETVEKRLQIKIPSLSSPGSRLFSTLPPALSKAFRNGPNKALLSMDWVWDWNPHSSHCQMGPPKLVYFVLWAPSKSISWSLGPRDTTEINCIHHISTDYIRLKKISPNYIP